MNYWKECISEAFDEAEITATKEQIDAVASFVKGAHETYGEVHGHYFIPDPRDAENDRLATELKKERDRVGCMTCGGRGYFVVPAGTSHISYDDCSDCNGEGKRIA